MIEQDDEQDTGFKEPSTRSRLLQCFVDCFAHWVIYWLCGGLCCLVGAWLVAMVLANIPFVGVTNQPVIAEEFERLDLASLRYILLEGKLHFPPPPPHPPW